MIKKNSAPDIKNIIFDLGGVLIDWNPDYVFLKVFKGDKLKLKEFYEKVCTFEWNENQDAGYPLDKATEDRIKIFPEYEDQIRMYYGKWEEMIGGEIKEVVTILKNLVRENNFRVLALTNWSAETFPIALKKFDFLHLFEGIVVSGTEKTRKPFSDIYEIILNRYNLIATESIFIDDNIRNIKAANKFGIKTIHFKDPLQLKTDLKISGILK
ncbi:HAD family hydrolase [Bacteroidetes bacterium SCGC AAA795-G10]|nr:HAD family hydrolase [Bacteroidetes bacterium SCGC AAA795-G10]